MKEAWKSWQWDGLGIGVAGLCLVHCLATSIILAVAATASSSLLDPIIHETGLFLAIVIGALALGRGVSQHRLMLPLVTGITGLFLMALSLTMPHGGREIAFSITGVLILAASHYLNYRALR
jgi:hypothetical protein